MHDVHLDRVEDHLAQRRRAGVGLVEEAPNGLGQLRVLAVVVEEAAEGCRHGGGGSHQCAEDLVEGSGNRVDGRRDVLRVLKVHKHVAARLLQRL